jgi:prevent-host-death family protein
MESTEKTLADSVKALSRVPASDVKRRGWRGVMRSVSAEGAVVVTNHNQPEAVILSAGAYANLLDRATQAEARVESDLALLRRRFD